jgi:hypothetical protein
MSSMHLMPSELIPTEVDLRPYDGLSNIRFRKEGELAIGLFLRNKDNVVEPVVTIYSRRLEGGPVVLPVPPEEANAAFEEPWAHANAAGKMAIEEVLAPETISWAA